MPREPRKTSGAPGSGAVPAAFLEGGGQLGTLIRAFDWSRTPLGPPEHWPQSLKTATAILLRSPVPIVLLWGREGTMIYNDAYAVFGGGRHPHLLGSPVLEGWPEVAEFNARVMRVGLAGGTLAYRDQHLILYRHGRAEDVWMNLDYSPVLDETGKPGGVLAIVVETTERVISERRLGTLRELGSRTAPARSVEEVCRSALAAMASENKADLPCAALYLIEGANRLKLIASYGPQSPDDTTPLDPAPLGNLEEPLAALRSGAAVLVSANPLFNAGSPDAPENLALLPINAAGTLSGLLAVGLRETVASPAGPQLDGRLSEFLELVAAQVSKAVATARALEVERDRAEALAALDRAKTAFFSNVSHEFRTPLTLLLGPLEAVAADPATPPAVRTQLERAHRNAVRLLKLVNSLLEFSRIEAGRITAWYEPTALAALTADIASTFRSMIERAGLELNVQCAPLDEPVYVDREMWEKIVLNLISNAFKFTFAGRITVNVRREATEAVLEVIDTGVGIPARELPRLFERFHRIEGTHGRTQEGTGIGLALVQELAKLHGGTVTAESEVGVGTTLRVRIPFGATHLPAERIRASEAPPPNPAAAQAFVQEALRWISPARRELAGMLPGTLETLTPPLQQRFARSAGSRVLLADDNADMRDYVRDLLAPLYAVEAVSDGEQALAAARRARPDLILSDILMPRLDGIAMLKALRADAELRDVPVVLLSARAGDESRDEGLDAGADDCLVKPFSARELLARVGTVLELALLRREHAQRLRESEAKYRSVFEHAAVGIEQLDLDGTLLDANHALCRMLGYPRDELLGRNFREITHPDDRDAEAALLGRLLAGELRSYSIEKRYLRRDGAAVWIRVSSSLAVTDERPLYRISVVEDITLRKTSEEALADADRRKDEFLAMLAHELRNPLAPIGNASAILSQILPADGPAQVAIGMIRRQTTQLTRLVDDLLDVSRITQGRIQLRRQPLELASVIAQAVETVGPQLREKRHRVSITTRYEPLYVNGDYARLVQCVGNILANAAKYTDAEGEIEVRARAEESTAVIEVTDTGAGIPSELLPHIFDLFVQSDRTLDRAQGGLGIGLAVVRRLIEMHGGEVSARSEGLGHGSTFEIRLPRSAKPEDASAELGRLRTPPRRVLIVDDNQDAADSLAMLLAFEGHETEAVYSGSEALERVHDFRPDVALLDIGLPEIDGYELARRLRAIPEIAGLRLVALTGYGQAEDLLRTRDAGFDGHLVKPVDLPALERTLAPPEHSASGPDRS